MRSLERVAAYGRMIKFSHSVFALPFAFSAAALAATRSGISWAQVGWIALAMVAARSAAMGFNRLADRHIDAANPRTRHRELPRRVLSPAAVGFFVALSALLLVGAAWRLNRLCLYLSPVALGVLLFYSFTKRFTWASHLILGLSLGLAPLGAWIAVAGGFAWPPALLGLGVLHWVAGFDILYACQDCEFDRASGLHSIPARFGPARALWVARLLHLLAVGFLLLLGWSMALGALYLGGVAAIAALLVYEHRLVRGGDLSKLGVAFTTMNGMVSLVYLVFTLADLFLLGEGALPR